MCKLICIYKLTEFLVTRFYYDPRSNVLWCLTPKAGSTTYMAAFERVAEKQSARLNPKLNIRVAVKQFFPFNSRNMERVLAKKPFIFSVSRHPYERLVSAFTDFRTKPNTSKNKVRGSFESFLKDKVLKEADLCSGGVSCRVNPHWDSLDNLCSYCALNYTVLSSMDTFSEDFTHITARLGLTPQAKYVTTN